MIAADETAACMARSASSTARADVAAFMTPPELFDLWLRDREPGRRATI
jgi:hypothetical protein